MLQLGAGARPNALKAIVESATESLRLQLSHLLHVETQAQVLKGFELCLGVLFADHFLLCSALACSCAHTQSLRNCSILLRGTSCSFSEQLTADFAKLLFAPMQLSRKLSSPTGCANLSVNLHCSHPHHHARHMPSHRAPAGSATLGRLRHSLCYGTRGTSGAARGSRLWGCSLRDDVNAVRLVLCGSRWAVLL